MVVSVRDIRDVRKSLKENALDENYWERPLPDDVVKHIVSVAWAHKILGQAIAEIERQNKKLGRRGVVK